MLVVGAGQMGGGIAQVVAASGRTVLLHDAVPGAVERGIETMGRSLEKLHEKGGPPAAEVLGRVTPVDGLAEADLLIEAIVENAEVKKQLFRAADEALPAHAILASNTSSIPITELAAATSRPERVIGMHFFNPVPVLALADLIGLDTCVAIMEVLHDGLGDQKYAPCPLLRRYVAAGRLGRKSGRGFYDYG